MESERAILEQAGAALAAGDARRALDRLLAAWRARRAPDLADAIDRLSARIAASQPPIEGRTQQDRLVAWVRLARELRPADLGRLLISYEEERAHEHIRLIVPRLDELEKRADDPRPLPALLRTAAMKGGGPGWRKVYLRVMRCLAAAGDPRAIAGLEDLLERERTGKPMHSQSNREFLIAREEQALARLSARFPAGAPALSGDAALALAGVIRAIDALPATLDLAVGTDRAGAAAPTDVEALTRAVYASPDDDDTRQVLGDALAERGDPRGEFIVLQMARAAGRADRRSERRERGLLKPNLKAWLGPLGTVVKTAGAVFERGFLAECVVEAKNAATAQTELHHPEWATVRKITFTRAALVTPAMRALEEVHGLTDDGLRRLAAIGHPRLRSLAMGSPAAVQGYDNILEAGVPRGGLKALAACRSLPALERLELGIGAREYRTGEGLRPRLVSDFDWVFAAPWGPQLRSLLVPAEGAVIDRWAREFVERRRLDRLEVGNSMVRIVFERQADGACASLRPSNSGDGGGAAPPYVTIWLESILSSFSPDVPLRSVRVELGPDRTVSRGDAARLRAVASRLRGVVDVQLPPESG